MATILHQTAMFTIILYEERMNVLSTFNFVTAMATNEYQFRSDNPGMLHLQCRRFSCRSWAPLTGDGDGIITELA